MQPDRPGRVLSFSRTISQVQARDRRASLGVPEALAIAGELFGMGRGPGAEGFGGGGQAGGAGGEVGAVFFVEGEPVGVAAGVELALLVGGAGEFGHDGFGFIAGGDVGEFNFDAG
jgi:hypothetical protein